MNRLANLGAAAKGTQKPAPAEKEPVKRQTLYLPLSIWRTLRTASTDLEKPQQEIFREALDLWFAEHSLPSWQDQLDAAAKKKGKSGT